MAARLGSVARSRSIAHFGSVFYFYIDCLAVVLEALRDTSNLGSAQLKRCVGDVFLGVGQHGRPRDLGSRLRRFESCRLDQKGRVM